MLEILEMVAVRVSIPAKRNAASLEPSRSASLVALFRISMINFLVGHVACSNIESNIHISESCGWLGRYRIVLSKNTCG